MNDTLAILGGKPCLSTPLQPFVPHQQEDAMAAAEVIKSGLLSDFLGSPGEKFYGGQQVRRLEEKWQALFSVKHAISVNSATSGLIAAMGAIGISPGDEVIVPPYTMSASAMAPLFYGGIPVFVDIEDETFCLALDKVAAAITPRTKAILVVNLFGHPARLRALRALADKHKIALIEDNAQAVCAKEHDRWAGTIGHLGIFSFNVHKHLNIGEGGMVVTNDPNLAQRLQLIRNHGENIVEWLEVADLTNLMGYNFRLSEVHAAIGLQQVSRLGYLTERAANIGASLSQGLKDLPGLQVPVVRHGCTHQYFMWSCCLDAAQLGMSRKLFCQALQAEGVPISAGYVKPLYYLPIFQQRQALGRDGFPFNLSDVSYEPGLCPVTESLHFERLIQFQPVSWDVSAQQCQQIINAFCKVYEHRHALVENKAFMQCE